MNIFPIYNINLTDIEKSIHTSLLSIYIYLCLYRLYHHQQSSEVNFTVDEVAFRLNTNESMLYIIELLPGIYFI